MLIFVLKSNNTLLLLKNRVRRVKYGDKVQNNIVNSFSVIISFEDQVQGQILILDVFFSKC